MKADIIATNYDLEYKLIGLLFAEFTLLFLRCNIHKIDTILWLHRVEMLFSVGHKWEQSMDAGSAAAAPREGADLQGPHTLHRFLQRWTRVLHLPHQKAKTWRCYTIAYHYCWETIADKRSGTGRGKG